MSRATLDNTIDTVLADHSKIEAFELRQVHKAQADYGDEQDALKVDKVAGKSLVADTEITKLSEITGTNTGDETTATIKNKLGITTLSGENTGDQDISVKANIDTQSAITYAATVTLDFNQADIVRTLALTGNVTFAAASNKAAAKNKVVIITAGASSRTLAFPGWTFVGATAPTDIAANKTGVLSLYCSGTTEASVIASYTVQP